MIKLDNGFAFVRHGEHRSLFTETPNQEVVLADVVIDVQIKES